MVTGSGIDKKAFVVVAMVLVFAFVYLRFFVYTQDSGKTVDLPLWEVLEVKFEEQGVFLKVHSWPSDSDTFSAKKEKDSRWIYFEDMDLIQVKKGGKPAGKEKIENLINHGLLHIDFGKKEEPIQLTIDTEKIKAQRATKAWVYN